MGQKKITRVVLDTNVVISGFFLAEFREKSTAVGRKK